MKYHSCDYDLDDDVGEVREDDDDVVRRVKMRMVIMITTMVMSWVRILTMLVIIYALMKTTVMPRVAMARFVMIMLIAMEVA